MASVEELWEGRRENIDGAKSTAELSFLVSGVADESEVKPALIAGTPTYYDGLPRLSAAINERLSKDKWKCSVSYGLNSNGGKSGSDTTQSNIAFDISGTTEHITQALSHVQTIPANGFDAPDCKGAIGYDGKSVQGCDIIVPTFEWHETHYMSPREVDPMTISQMVGTINSDNFRGPKGGITFEPGEVLFMGASGQYNAKLRKYEMGYKFAARKTERALTIGGITVEEKRGWDYLWVLYQDDVDGAAGARVRIPKAVYIERVYKESEFSTLNLPAVDLSRPVGNFGFEL